MLPLDVSLDRDLAAATFHFWKEHLQPWLGPEYELGVAGLSGTTVTRDVRGFTDAMQLSIEGVSYTDPGHLATDRTQRVWSCLQDPSVVALWMYNGGPPSPRSRENISNAMLLIVQGIVVRLQELKEPNAALKGTGVPCS